MPYSIINGDALDWLRGCTPRTIDAVITDPPYGINTKSDGSGKLSPWADYCNAAYWYAEWLRLCRVAIKPTGFLWSFLNWRSIVTFQKAACDTQWPIESLAIWDKCWIGPGGVRGLRPSYECVALWCGDDAAIQRRNVYDIFKAPWSSQHPYGHPAEKPEAAIDWILDVMQLPAGSLVVDPFMGSGTTGAVAIRRGYRFIGCELDEGYCRIAEDRFSDASAISSQVALGL